MSDRPIATLPTLMSGLTIRGVECVLHFNRPAPVRPLATATVRGLAGHLLASTHPALVGRWFKRGDEGHLPSVETGEKEYDRPVGFKPSHLPPAYLFEALTHDLAYGAYIDSLPFNIRTWDPPGELLPAFLDALKLARDRPFGESGASIKSVSFGQIKDWEFAQTHCSMPQATLEFLTPIRLKASGRWLGKEEVTMGHLVEAAVRRLELLSEHYGAWQKLDATPFLAAASKVRESTRSLRWISPRRRSSSQGTDLALSGLVGRIRFAEIPSLLVDLLNAVATVHIGHKTGEGCGQLRLVT